jgi:hypothetical protein
MTQSLFQLQPKSIEVFNLVYPNGGYCYKAEDYRFLGYFDQYLKRLNPANQPLFAYVSTPHGANYNAVIPLDSEGLGTLAIVLAFVLARDYEGSIDKAWRDGPKSLLSHMKFACNDIKVNATNETLVDQMMKSLYPFNAELADILVRLDHLFSYLDKIHGGLSGFVNRFSQNRFDRFIHRRDLSKAREYLKDTERILSIVSDREKLLSQREKILEFVRSDTLFSYDPDAINKLIEDFLPPAKEIRRFLDNRSDILYFDVYQK